MISSVSIIETKIKYWTRGELFKLQISFVSISHIYINYQTSNIFLISRWILQSRQKIEVKFLALVISLTSNKSIFLWGAKSYLYWAESNQGELVERKLDERRVDVRRKERSKSKNVEAESKVQSQGPRGGRQKRERMR